MRCHVEFLYGFFLSLHVFLYVCSIAYYRTLQMTCNVLLSLHTSLTSKTQEHLSSGTLEDQGQKEEKDQDDSKCTGVIDSSSEKS